MNATYELAALQEWRVRFDGAGIPDMPTGSRAPQSTLKTVDREPG